MEPTIIPKLTSVAVSIFERLPPRESARAHQMVQEYFGQMKEELKDKSMAELTLGLMNLVDKAMREFVSWDKITCKAGCNHCCKINVDISESEAEILVDYAQEHKIKINKETLEKQRNLTDRDRPKSRFADCVFLSKEGTCKVYEVRPLVCRKYLVQTDPKLCDSRKYPGQKVGINIEVNTELLVVAHSLLPQKVGNMATMLTLAKNKK